MVSVNGQNQVITLLILGEIYSRVINNVVCPNGARDVQVPRAAYGSHFRPEGFGNLHGKCTHAARRPINENLLPWLNSSFIAKSLKRGECCYRNGSGCLKRYVV